MGGLSEKIHLMGAVLKRIPQAEFESDLRQPQFRARAAAELKSIPPQDYSLEEWMDVADYLTDEKHAISSYQEVADFCGGR